MKILIIGCGNMGRTYAQAFLNARVVKREQIWLLEHDPAKETQLTAQNIGRVRLSPGDWMREMTLIILAVKPQDTGSMFAQIAPYIDASKIVLSIMAGIPIQQIQEALSVQKVVRAMPNLPAQIGVGMTVFKATTALAETELELVRLLLETTGSAIQVELEDLVDASTAISGSGPAYVYYFMEAMKQQALAFGFADEAADLLVKQTFSGAVELYSQNALSYSEWIQKVASRGGTTEAALKVFGAEEVNSGIRKGVQSAYERAKELSK